MKKRGHAILWFLFELIAAIIIIWMAWDITTTLSKGTIFDKLIIARDISLQTNTLSGLPGDGYIVNKDLHGYSLRFFYNKVEVFEASHSKGTHYFVAVNMDPNIDPESGLVFEKPAQVAISKINDGIIISENIPNLN